MKKIIFGLILGFLATEVLAQSAVIRGEQSPGVYVNYQVDPCQANTKVYLAISQNASAQLITGVAAKKTYICSILIIVGATENVALTAGTGTVCATGASALIGSTTVANGLILAANGGFNSGNGAGTIAAGTVNADNICLLQSGVVRVSGVITYVQQ